MWMDGWDAHAAPRSCIGSLYLECCFSAAVVAVFFSHSPFLISVDCIDWNRNSTVSREFSWTDTSQMQIDRIYKYIA